MNITVSRNGLFKALQKIVNVIPSKTTIDILYNILLNIEDSKLKIVATDLEITQISWCDCKVEETGSIVLPGKLLMDILREMPETHETHLQMPSVTDQVFLDQQREPFSFHARQPL